MDEKLAIEGGPPEVRRPFPSWPRWDHREEELLLEVLHSGKWGSLVGDKVARFERLYVDFLGVKHGICLANGTLALEVALRALGVGLGDHVITTPYTFIATANAILLVGAIPIFVDIDPATFNMDVGKIEAAITERTKAILPVHMAGLPADMDAICDIARRHGLAIVEDACQAWGSEWRGKRVGSIGDLAAFSFQLSKNISAGEGGIVVTNDDDFADFCWSFGNVGRRKGGQWYEHVRLGANYRLTEWQGAVLLAQFERFPQDVEKRSVSAAYLQEALKSIDGVEPVEVDARVTAQSHHLFMARYDQRAFGGATRETFLQALNAEGVPASPGYTPVNKSPAIQDGLRLLARALPDIPPSATCPVAEQICTEAVWFPHNVLLADEEALHSVVTAIRKIQTAFGTRRHLIQVSERTRQ